MPDRELSAVRGNVVCAKQAGGGCPRGIEKYLLNQGKSAPLLHRLGLNAANIMDNARKRSYKARLAKCLDFQLQNANRVHWAFLQSQAYSSETLNYN